MAKQNLQKMSSIRLIHVIMIYYSFFLLGVIVCPINKGKQIDGSIQGMPDFYSRFSSPPSASSPLSLHTSGSAGSSDGPAAIVSSCGPAPSPPQTPSFPRRALQFPRRTHSCFTISGGGSDIGVLSIAITSAAPPSAPRSPPRLPTPPALDCPLQSQRQSRH